MSGTIHYTLTQDDYLAANREHAWLLMANGPGALTAACVGMLATAIVVLTDGRVTSPAAAAVIFLTTTPITWLIVFGLSLAVLPWRVLHFFRQQPGLTEPTTVTWDDAAFKSEAESATVRTRWHDMTRWAESREALLIYPNDLIFYVLPNRALSPEARSDLLAQLAANGIPQWRRWRNWRRPVKRKR